tara:strand:+ start:2017 stop:3825 length:1809 start_codon:yes stop_codon:yes gene_type:complete
MTNPMKFIQMLKTLLRAIRMRPLDKDLNLSLGKLIASNAKSFPDREFLRFEGTRTTWGEFNNLANQYAQELRKNDIKYGDCVAVLMENSAAFLTAIVGISKLGAIAGLINVNQRKSVLAHSIALISPKMVLLDDACIDAYLEIRDNSRIQNIKVMCTSKESSQNQLEWASAFCASKDRKEIPDPEETERVKLKDSCFYLFTSGTTALPKAAVVSNERLFRAMQGYGRVCLDLKGSDRLYNCLPLYHATGLIVGFGSVAYAGAQMFLRKNFSSSAFLRETREEKTNIFIYVGELCRYLISGNEDEEEARNPIIKAIGNGLRPDIWMEFKERLGIPEVYELYGASEGNAGFVNAFNKDETIGFGITPHLLVQADNDTGESIRSKDGTCRVVKKGEVGLLLTEISKNARFDGYTDSAETDKKLIRDVLVKGDVYFNTGDLMRQVDVGFAFWKPHYQFVDRTGDTFRWKGENCSTSEVEGILNRLEGISSANVYGVLVPGTEGRAGMAAVTLSADSLFLDENARNRFYEELSSELPPYAIPLFVRILKRQPQTSTFKLQKNELREEAYHLGRSHGDLVFVLKPGESSYTLLKPEFYELIQGGQGGF